MQDILVSNGVIQNPYREFNFTIAAGASDIMRYDHINLRVMSLSGGSPALQFGQNGSPTSIVGAGVGFKYLDENGSPIALRDVRIYNLHATDPMTITLGAGMVDISDSRLALSGNVTVQNTSGGALYIRNQTGASLDVLDTQLLNRLALSQGQNALTDLGKSLLTTTGGTFASVAATTTTILAAGSNANGAIINLCSLYSGSQAVGLTELRVGTGGANVIARAAGQYSAFNARDIFVPAGQAIVIAASGTASAGDINYKTL